jgi:hypothetical protein
MLFMPIIFYCTVGTVELAPICAFKALPAVSSPRYCSQTVEEVKAKVEPNLKEFKLFAISCVQITQANEV